MLYGSLLSTKGQCFSLGFNKMGRGLGYSRERTCNLPSLCGFFNKMMRVVVLQTPVLLGRIHSFTFKCVNSWNMDVAFLLNRYLEVLRKALQGILPPNISLIQAKSSISPFSQSNTLLSKDVIQLTNAFLENKFLQKCKDYLSIMKHSSL